LKNISVSLRLTAWFSAIFLCGFIIFGLVMRFDLAYSLSSGRDRTLARRAARLIDLLESSRADSPARLAVKFDEFADATPEGNLIQIFDSSGNRFLPQAPLFSDFPWPEISGIVSEQYTEVTHRHRLYRILARRVRWNSRELCIVVPGNLEDNRQLLGRFSTGLAASIPALLSLAALAGYFMSRRALQPVDRLTAAFRSISIGNLSGRLPIHNTGDELQRLAETCNDMLARLERAVGRINRFTSDASHELRSPISFFRTVAEYALQNPKIDEESKQAFQEIFEESVEATQLLEDMLTLARADAGHSNMQFERLNLGELVEDVCKRALPLAETKRQALALKANGPVQISGDRSSLRRLLWTLLDNAVKYTPECGRIEVALQKMGSEVRVTVRDSGIGIPEAMLPRIFDRFFRADPSRSEVNGTGLGLAIAKWIADLHHGSLSVQSREGEGTVFAVALPVVGSES
jgi:heavy metal sensor kinase